MARMTKKKERKPDDYIQNMNINKMRGRMLRLPGPKNKKREIMFVYGHHSSLERWWGVVEDLSSYGTVTMPDLPGFGGMQSFYKIGEKPTIDNFADYLAAFVKLRYGKQKKITIVGLSFGFVIATRMLQRYPELAKKVDLLVSVVGFTHKDDFTFSKSRYLFYKNGARLFSIAPTAIFFKSVFLHPLVIRTLYTKTHNAKEKFKDADLEEAKKLANFEVYLWRCNDVRTYMKTTVEFLDLNNCNKTVDLPVWHITVDGDRYFDHQIVEQHMKVIFSNYHEAKSKMSTHAPSVIADMKTAKPLIPTAIRRLLARQP